MINPFDQVVLTRDLVDSGLKTGCVGCVVEVYDNSDAFEVEFTTMRGRTIAVVTLSPSDIREFDDNDILCVRDLQSNEAKSSLSPMGLEFWDNSSDDKDWNNRNETS